MAEFIWQNPIAVLRLADANIAESDLDLHVDISDGHSPVRSGNGLVSRAGIPDLSGGSVSDVLAIATGGLTLEWVTAGSGGVTDHGALTGLADDDHSQYHNDARGDARYFTKTEHLNSSAGAGDSGKPIKLDAGGKLDASMLNDADVDHGSIGGLADDDHSQYHNDTRGDARYVQIADEKVIYHEIVYDSSSVAGIATDTEFDIKCTLPAGVLNALDRLLRVRAHFKTVGGIISNASFTFKLRLGNTVVGSHTPFNSTAGAFVSVGSFDETVRPTTIGASGVVEHSYWFSWQKNKLVTNKSPNSTSSIDLTAALDVEYSVSIGSASANTASLFHIEVEVFQP